MKFSLTITDATLEEVSSVIAKINNAYSVSKLDGTDLIVASAVEKSLNAPRITPAKITATDNGGYIVQEVEQESDGSGVDADGLPWDARIHSSNKKKTAKGVWVARRNVDDATYEKVVAELRGGAQNQVAAQTDIEQVIAATPEPVVTVAPPVLTDIPAFLQPAPVVAPVVAASPAPASPVVPVLESVPVAPVVAAPIAPVVAAAPAAPAVCATYTIADLTSRIQSLFAQQKADAPYVIQLQQRIGQQFGMTIASITDIQARPDMIKWAMDAITADGK